MLETETRHLQPDLLSPKSQEDTLVSPRPLANGTSHSYLRSTASQVGYAGTEVGTQSGSAVADAETQSAARELSEEQKEALLQSHAMACFLQRVLPRYEHALQQNDIIDVYGDDFAGLEDGEGAEGAEGAGKGALLTEVQTFTDLGRSKGRAINAVHWHPSKKGMVAMSCGAASSYSGRGDGVGIAPTRHILVWSMNDPLRPHSVLESPEEILSFQYNPMNADVIAAGCLNGQVALWDMGSDDAKPVGSSMAAPSASGLEDTGEPAGEEGSLATQKSVAVNLTELRAKDRDLLSPAQMSSSEGSHKAPVTDLVWLPAFRPPRSDGRPHQTQANSATLAKRCNVFATTAADGRVLFWDITAGRLRKKVKRKDTKGEDEEVEWRPIYAVTLISSLKEEPIEAPASRMCFRAKDTLHEKFFIGSNDGQLLLIDLVPQEVKDRDDGAHHPQALQAHENTVVAMQRCPFVDDTFVTVGAWSWALWGEHRHDAPLLRSPPAPTPYTCGCWSPSRPGVLFMARGDGVLEAWDLIDRTHAPAVTMHLAAVALTFLAFNSPSHPLAPAATHAHLANARPGPQLLSAGDALGVLHVVEVPRGLKRPLANEAQLLADLVARQTAHLAYLDSRKDARLRATQAATMARFERGQAEAEAAKPAPAPSAPPTGRQAPQEPANLDKEYQDFERDIRIHLGLPSS
ncbi:hypothetical protein WJX73_004849 [Symbiochloris irregularis]|uniref:Uncharacterized protein n=1 Tax=Symbiochloris irregularis TaxID=706552 RepID=A0AAW1NUI8_9CHLO